jgi:hypothetical protein
LAVAAAHCRHVDPECSRGAADAETLRKGFTDELVALVLRFLDAALSANEPREPLFTVGGHISGQSRQSSSMCCILQRYAT